MQQAKICYFICDFTRTPIFRFDTKRPTFRIETHCVLYQNGGRFLSKRKRPLSRFGAKRAAIWGKTDCDLGQNGLRFGAKRKMGVGGFRRKKKKVVACGLSCLFLLLPLQT